MNDLISREAARDKIESLINEMESIFSDIREKLVDDSVCGLCEYDCDHGIDGCANECPGFERDDCFKLKEKYRDEWMDMSGILSVMLEQRWIPLKDREPEKEGEYLVTFDDGFVATVTYSETDTNGGMDWELWADSGEPIAWMFLPEPYRESEGK